MCGLKYFLAAIATVSCLISYSSSSGMIDYLGQVMTTSDISFAHLRAGNTALNGWWTKEHRCSPGSYMTDYDMWLSPEGALLAIRAYCKSDGARKSTNVIDISTTGNTKTAVPHKYGASKGEYARGFVVHTWLDSSGKRAHIGNRKFIVEKNPVLGCTKGAQLCSAKQFLCSGLSRICSLQVKIHGGDGSEGGSITRLRFRCCYVCPEFSEKEVVIWESSESERTFRSTNGTYGVRTLRKTVGARTKSSGGNSTELEEEYEDFTNGTFSSEEVIDYDDYLEETEEQEVEAEAKKTLVRARRALNARFTKNSNEDKMFETTDDKTTIKEILMQSGKNETWKTPAPRKSLKESAKDKETFDCAPGFMCQVRQKETVCGHFEFKDPAVLVKQKVQTKLLAELRSPDGSKKQDDSEIWVTVPNVITVSSYLRASNITWQEKAVCPNGSYVIDHRQEGSRLDSAKVHKGIILACARADGQNVEWVTSAIGAQRKWNTIALLGNAIANGYRFIRKPVVRGFFYELIQKKAKFPFSSDNSAASSAAMEFRCPENWAVCGFRLTEPEKPESRYTSVEFKCCYHYIPEERFQEASRIYNPASCGATHTATAQPGPTFIQSAEGTNLDFLLSYGQTGSQGEHLCPVGSVATLVRTKAEHGLGMTGFEMQCSRLTAHRGNDPSYMEYENSQLLAVEVSAVSGKWDNKMVGAGRPVSGFYVDRNRGKEMEGFAVSYGPLFDEDQLNNSAKTEALFCPPHHKVCGFGYETDAANEIIARLQLKCCLHCVPEENWESLDLGTANHMEGENPQTRVNITIGVTYVRNDSQPELDFGIRSMLKEYFAARLTHKSHWNGAQFPELGTQQVLRPPCNAIADRRTAVRCEIKRLVGTCGPFKVLTTYVRASLKHSS